jgi:hypothetical protein
MWAGVRRVGKTAISPESSMSISMRRIFAAMIAATSGIGGLLAAAASHPAHAAPCKRCGWVPPETRVKEAVRSMEELRRALGRARPGTTILLEDGIYRLGGSQLDVAIPDFVLRGKRGDRSKVVIRGEGMEERIVAISVSAPGVTLADLTVGYVGFHGIQVRGESKASDVVIHNVRVVDTGQQLIKGSTTPSAEPSRHGLIACSRFEYSDHAPSDYTNGVDVLKGEGWVVRDNVFLRIRGPREQGWRAGPTILFWRGSRDTIVERNWILDCYRGIALGLVEAPEDRWVDHQGGVIRRNILCNLNPWADEGIEANAALGVLIEHNTVLVEGRVPWSISIRFPTAEARVWNNLSNHRVELRDGAVADLQGNVVTARRDWFVDPARGDLRLARGDVAAIDAGVVIPEGGPDGGRKPSFLGAAPDAGAIEFRSGR